MKKRLILWIAILIPGLASAFEKLDDRYLITYGNSKAPHQIVEYFSFSCPYCASLFASEFSKIKRSYIDTGEVYWVFHPIPVDLLTLSAMACLWELPQEHKRIFLEELLPEANEEQPKELARLMGRVMDLFGVEMKELTDLKALEERPAFEAAFLFLKGGGLEVQALPSLEIGGELSIGELPTADFIGTLVESNRGGEG